MTTQPQDPATPTLTAIDVRLSHVEKQVGEIHRAIVGSTDGSIKGLQSRVERLRKLGKVDSRHGRFGYPYGPGKRI
jgi:hypothetical protein